MGVTRALKQADGNDFGVPTTFDLIKTPAPLITDGTVLPAIEPVLQCAPLVAGAPALATPSEVQELATQLEPLRQLWAPTFAALEAAEVPRESLLLAWRYTTQSLTAEVDRRKAALFAGDFDSDDARVMPLAAPRTDTASIAALFQVVDTVCVQACFANALPTVPRHRKRALKWTARPPRASPMILFACSQSTC